MGRDRGEASLTPGEGGFVDLAGEWLFESIVRRHRGEMTLGGPVSEHCELRMEEIGTRSNIASGIEYWCHESLPCVLACSEYLSNVYLPVVMADNSFEIRN